MSQSQEIKDNIQALGEMTSPASITPFTLAVILQSILSFVESLELKPKSEVDVMAQLQQAVNAANSALATANTANSNAQKCVIATLSFTQDEGGVSLTVKQAGYPEKTDFIPTANETMPGLLTPQVLKLIVDTAAAVVDNKITKVTATASSGGVTLGLVSDAGTLQKALPVASPTNAGVMTGADKQKLNNLPAKEDIATLKGGCLNLTQCPPIVLLKVDESPFDDEEPAVGDAWLDAGHIYYAKDSATQVDLGTPSKHLVYVHKATGLQYRWTGSKMELIGSDPRTGMEVVNVTCASTTRKTYAVPAGVLAVLKPTTDVANILLQAGPDGKAAIHRLVIERSDIGSLTPNATCLVWPSSLIWSEDTKPQLQDIDDNTAILVTVINSRYAHFRRYR